MSYIWENYREENEYKIARERYSPYLEVWEDRELSNHCIEVNVLNRFFPIFEKLMEQEETDDSKDIANLLIHFLAQLDHEKGVHTQALCLQIIEEEIQTGYFGNLVKEAYIKLNIKEQKIILESIYNMNKMDGRKLVFMEAIKRIFNGCAIYYRKSEETFILYLQETKTAENEAKLALIRELFLDFTHRLETVWEHHMGVIEVANTMHIGEISIY